MVELTDVPLFITGLDERVTRLRLGDRTRPVGPRATIRPTSGESAHVVQSSRRRRQRVHSTQPATALEVHAERSRAGPHRRQPAQHSARDHAAGGRPSGGHTRSVPTSSCGADREYRFSVYRDINVADDRLTIDVATRTTEAGDLIIEQLITNHADRDVSLRCYLRGPDMHHQARQVRNLGRGTDVQHYQIAGGADRVGKSMLLEVREVLGDRRTLNHWFTVER